MALRIGLVGLPNAGKSTLFNALTAARVDVGSYPFTTIEPNYGVAAVSDRRLERIFDIVRSERAVPATVEFVDIAGLVKGSSQGEGLGNQFLGHIRNTDALALVLRCFEDSNVAHVSAQIDPVADLGVLDLELMLADLATVQRRIEKVRTQAKARPKDYAEELQFLQDLEAELNRGKRVLLSSLGDKEREWVLPLNLLTVKPRLLVANVGESDLPEGNDLAKAVCRAAESEGARCVVLCARTEAELTEWPDEEAVAYRLELGVVEPGRDALVRAGYELLNLITFFTATGSKEVRAWPIPRGTTAGDAAGRIHSDIQRGFIRAEVVPFDVLDSLGSFAAVREKGLLRLEGREYVIQDGDIVHFRFNV
jgi:GTP-binding protein YchF